MLSAKTAERLQEVVANLHQALTQDARYTDDDLAAIAYTLQVGREAMVERLAFLATSIEELAAKLQACLAVMSGTDPHALDEVADLFRGRAGGGPHEALAAFTADDELQDAIDKWVQRQEVCAVVAPLGRGPGLRLAQAVWRERHLWPAAPPHQPADLSLRSGIILGTRCWRVVLPPAGPRS